LLKAAIDFARQALSLTKDMQQIQADVKDLRADVTGIREEVRRLGQAVEALIIRIQRNEENAAHERANLLLRLENEFLKRGLAPPADSNA
jgi:predicted  nucleic acid-binding Zn-ribbon protein